MHLRHFFMLAFALLTQHLIAQSPVNGFFNPKGKGAVALSYNTESYDNVFLVPLEAKGVPIFNDVRINSVSLYAQYALSDRFEVSAGLPYISARGNASQTILDELGFENERSGIQDLSLHLKYRPLELLLGDNRLAFMTAAGVRTPLGSYRADEGLQSILAIGNRATALNAVGGAHFQSRMGLFATTQIGYSLRSGDVPNALIGEVKAGYAGRYFYVDAWYAGQTSDGGVNILGEGFTGNFPATDVTFTRAGLNLYVPVAGGFGLSAGVNKYLSGRNIGEATGYSFGLVYTL